MVKTAVKINTIISVFGLDKKGFSQSNVDFFNLNLEKDNLAFVDYNRLTFQSDSLCIKMNDKLKAYLFRLFEAAAKDSKNGLVLLDGINECNYTFLGYSKGKPGGKSLGDTLKLLFLSALAFLKEAYLKDQLSLNTMRLGIKNISYDRVSDFTVNIIIEYLIEYTNQQCTLHNIECGTKVILDSFDLKSGTWKESKYLLPNHNDKPIIFIPKKLISSKGKAVCTIDQFVSFGFKNFIQNSPEVRHLKTNGKLTYKAYKEHLKETGRSLKDVARELLSKNKDILSEFENLKVPNIEELSANDLQDITNLDK